MISQNMVETAAKILKSHALFSDCSFENLKIAAKGCAFLSFAEGEELKSYNDRPFLCMIHMGAAKVYTLDKNSELLLRKLTSGDIFGVATLFGHTGQTSVTRIIASEETQAVCMSEDIFKELLIKDSALTMRYIDFLADRIRFLNRRIACVSAGSAEEKLCAWLYDQLDGEEDACTYILPLAMTELAEVLGLGRASLYRAFDELQAHGILERNAREIRIFSKTALQNYGLNDDI